MIRIWLRFTNDVTAANPDYGECTGVWRGTCFTRSPLAVGITSKNTMMVIVQAFCLLCFLGLTVWQLNHLTWNITDYRVRISTDLAKETHIEQSDK